MLKDRRVAKVAYGSYRDLTFTFKPRLGAMA